MAAPPKNKQARNFVLKGIAPESIAPSGPWTTLQTQPPTKSNVNVDRAPSLFGHL